jgi:uncharacterized protein (TIGR00730 family)
MRSVGVFLSTSSDTPLCYQQATIELGRVIAKLGVTIVYGGAKVGLMGQLADAVLQAGGRVIGVMCRELRGEITYNDLSELYVVDTMQARKQKIAALSDAFIAFPGGLGTLEELFEVWSAIKIGLYAKPLTLFNVDGFFDSLLTFLDHAKQCKMIRADQLTLMHVSHSIEAVTCFLEDSHAT